MNRYKKEQAKKYIAARKGLSANQITHLDMAGAVQKKVDCLMQDLHMENFSEEYDFMYDSNVDASERGRGINPMSQEYINQVQKKREALGITPLSPAGNAVSGDSYDLCYEDAKKKIYSDVNIKKPPAKACISCGKSLDDKENNPTNLISNEGIGLFKDNTNPQINQQPHITTKLYPDQLVSIVIWGNKELCTDAMLDKAKTEFMSGRQPWFCLGCTAKMVQK